MAKSRLPLQFDRRTVGGFVGVLLTLLLLALHLAAVGQSIHDQICSDAATADHHCAITELAAGHLLDGPAPDPLPLPDLVPAGVVVEPKRYFTVVASLLPSDRGPPELNLGS